MQVYSVFLGLTISTLACDRQQWISVFIYLYMHLCVRAGSMQLAILGIRNELFISHTRTHTHMGTTTEKSKNLDGSDQGAAQAPEEYYCKAHLTMSLVTFFVKGHSNK